MLKFNKITNLTFKKAFEKLIEIRVVENLIAQEFKKNKVYSFLHLYTGQEACAVGVGMAVKKNDYFFGNHRSHGHYLAKNGNLKKMIYEIFGDPRGCCLGYGGSMHLLDQSKKFYGSIPILGSSVSIASGLAMSKKLKKESGIVVIFLGDGSAEEGSFYETINLAGLYRLPLLIVIEDNRYAVESDFEKRKVKGYNFKKIFGEGLKSIYRRVDGQNFVKVFNATSELRNKIIREKKVGVLHLDCIRFAKHSGANINLEDQRSKYRKKNEYLEIKKRDPILMLKRIMIKNGLCSKKLSTFEKKIYKKYEMKFYETFKKIKIRKI